VDAEHAREVALVGKTADDGDLGEAHLRFAQQCLGMLDTLAEQPPVRRITRASLEGTHEIAERQPTFIRDLGKRDVPAQICHHRLLRAPELPGGKSATLGAWSHLHAAKYAGKIGIHREQYMPCVHRRDFVGTFKRREKGLTKVPNGPVFDAAFASEIVDPGNAVVVCDFMKRGPGHNKYQAVKRAKKIRTGSVEMIDDADCA
jgi:hypothetical protein